MINVLYSLTNLSIGGIEVLSLDLCRNALNNGIKLFVVISNKGPLLDEFSRQKIDLYILKRRNKLSIISYIYKLRRILKKNHIKVIHSNQLIEAILAIIASFGLSIKHIFSFHGHQYFGNRNILAFSGYLVALSSAKLVFVSEHLRNYYNSHYSLPNTPQFVIHNGIDLLKFLSSKKKDLRRELLLNQSIILLGCVGNFSPGRDQLTICRAFKKIIEKNKNVHLVFIGGQSRSNPLLYQQCIDFCQKENLMPFVHFLGERIDVPELLHSLDLFVYSSNTDTFGIAVAEAMIMGVPIILNDIPALMEITKNGKYAKVFHSKDDQGLAKCIEDFLQHKEKYTKIAGRAQKYAVEYYSIQRFINDLKTVYLS